MPPTPLSGTDTVSVRAWLRDLTYGEIHVFLWGAGLAGTGLWTPFVALLAFAFGHRASTSRDSKIDPDDLPAFVRRQLRRQPHYYLVGGAVGALGNYLNGGLDVPRVLEAVIGGGLI